jgi:hypothetical protein
MTRLSMARSPLPRLRRLCLALPEAHEVTAWGEPTFRVRNKMFASPARAIITGVDVTRPG